MTKNLITRKIQFLFLIGAILLAPSIARASAVTASVDSLQNLLQNDTDAGQRAIIYIHLADIHVDSLNISSQYWDKALTEAAKAKDEYMMKLALDNLIQRYASKNKEKVEKYITFARQYLPEEHNTLFLFQLVQFLFDCFQRIVLSHFRPTISAGRTQHPFPVLLVLLQHLGGNAKEQFAGNNRTGTGQAEKGKSRTNDT